MARILIANKFLSLTKPEAYSQLSCINFSSTYDKSLRTYNKLNQLFEVILERNKKPLTAGAFGFEERIKFFLQGQERSFSFSKFLETNFFPSNEDKDKSKSY